MKKILIIFGCVILLITFQSAFAGNGTMDNPGGDTDNTSPSDELSFDIFDIVESIIAQIMTGTQAYHGSGLAPLPKITDSMGCVNVDVNLPDTVSAYSPFDSTVTNGSLLVHNCDTQPAEIQLTFSFTISIDNYIDTTLIFEDIFINLEAGDSVYCDFIFPVPPFNATYTFCVTAVTSGGAGMTDCATMVVTGQDMPDIPYAAPGFLFQGEDCVLFMELGDSNLALIVENLGAFGPGDSVFVTGTLVDDCGIQCIGAGGCVIDNTIDSLGTPPPPPPFEACGALIQGPNCVLFTPLGFGDTAFVLDNYGDFQAGDTVSVGGELEIGCETECIGAMGCILNNSIDTCSSAPPPPPPTFEGCGVLVMGTNCVLFEPFTFGDSASFVLENYGNYQVFDTVFVSGELDFDCMTTCMEATACIINNTIDSCFIPPPPPPTFAGCGLVIEAPDCKVFMPFDLFNVFFILSDYGGYVHGDSIYVEGTVAPLPDTLGCSEPVEYLVVDTLMPCTLPPPPPFEACGILIQGPNCVLFTPLGYGDTAFVLDNYGEFQPYDTVFVSGELEIGCDTECIGAMGCILSNSIDTCSSAPPPPPPAFAGCGILVQGANCVLFSPGFYVDTLFTLSDYGTFGVGDSVFVEGEIYPGQDTVCLDAWGHIDNSIITPCQDSIPPIFTGCGYLYEDQGCIIFQPLDQPEAYLLYNYGDFGPGDTVFVDGEVVGCGTACDVVGCIDNPIIDSCAAPPPPTIAECGLLIETTDCVLFYSSVWFNAFFVLSDYGGFGPGDSVFVSGVLALLPDTIDCSGAVNYIQVDSIGLCGGSPGQQYAGIGYLGYEGSCLVYYDLYSYYTSYVLENYGDFVAGDTVYVDGNVELDCEFNCSDTALCLANNTIILANPADSIPVKDGLKKITDVRSYPNPFNPIAIISFNIPVQSRVTLEIYNILGQKVETLIDGEILQGEQEYPWNGDRYASGIYFYRIETEYDVVTKKMILNK